MWSVSEPFRAAVQAGEYIWSAEDVRRAGGFEALGRIRDKARQQDEQRDDDDD